MFHARASETFVPPVYCTVSPRLSGKSGYYAEFANVESIGQRRQECSGEDGTEQFRAGVGTGSGGLIEELELRNSRPIDPDLLAVIIDAKYFELREGDKLRAASIYLTLGFPAMAENKS